jgi:uncharacterized membrane protein
MIRNWLLPSIVGLAMAIAAYQGTLLATPYALMSAAMKKIGGQAPINSFGFGEPSTADNQPIVRPSPDLSYSSCVFDVSKGPVLVDVGPVPGSYWSLSIFDARTDVAQVLSERETGNGAARVMLIRDGIKLAPPDGYTPVRLNHDKGIALVRILVSSKADYPAIDAIRRKARCRAME